MTEALIQVLTSIIIPKYNSLLDVRVRPLDSVSDWFVVIYFYEQPFNDEFTNEIREETQTLIKMLGITWGNAIIRFVELH